MRCIHIWRREDIIEQFLHPGMSVLDIGSVGQTTAYSLWKLLEGHDIQLQGIDVISSGNPKIVLGDMETYSFHRFFDLIIAGDVIEHVMNQKLFLTNIRDHLKSDGKLILTTPNAKWPTVYLRPNPTHTLWHDRYTLTYLLTQCRFSIIVLGYYLGNKPYYHPLLKPLAWRQGLIAVCGKQ